jgi:arylsulfatase A-like enzyme
MSWKGHIGAGTHIREPLHVVDIFPTLSRIAGINLKKGLPLDGLDFSPLLDGTVSETEGIRFNEERPILINAEAHRGALRLGSWKLVVSRPGVSDSDSADDSAGTVQGKQSNSGSDFIAEKNETAAGRDGVIVELYNLSNDPAEMKDLASTEIMKREELLGHYRRFESQAKPALATSKKKLLKTPKVWGEWPEQ